MSDPHFYLPSAGAVDEQTSLDSNMPDLCIAYQLHLECGRHINLYDWLRVSACYECHNICFSYRGVLIPQREEGPGKEWQG